MLVFTLILTLVFMLVFTLILTLVFILVFILVFRTECKKNAIFEILLNADISVAAGNKFLSL